MGSGCDKCSPAGPGSLSLSDSVVARLLEASGDVKTEQSWMHKLEELQAKYAQEKGLSPEKIMELADSIRASCRRAKPAKAMQTYLQLRDEVIRCYSEHPPSPPPPGSALACDAVVSVLAQAADAGPDPDPAPDPDGSGRRRCAARCKLKCGQLFGNNSNS